MPGLGGAALIEALAARHPDLPLVVLSASESAADVRRVMALGALGYVPKSASPETLLAAFKLVLAGELYVPPLLLEEPPPAAACDIAAKLTPRQADVLACMCRGLSNKFPLLIRRHAGARQIADERAQARLGDGLVQDGQAAGEIAPDDEAALMWAAI